MAVDKRAAKRTLEEMMMIVNRYQSYLEAYRNSGDTFRVAKCERLLNIHYSIVRQHCDEHGLDVPGVVPPAGEG